MSEISVWYLSAQNTARILPSNQLGKDFELQDMLGLSFGSMATFVVYLDLAGTTMVIRDRCVFL